MPLLGDLVRDWQRGAQAVERGDWGCALRLFSGIPDPPAKICFNVGCVHLLAGDPEAALRAFDQALTKDVWMAVGFFQRGATNFLLERFQEALSDFRLALAQLRDNSAIDYTQLGLRFKLQAWEVLFNVAAAQCRLGLWAEATRSLEEAAAKGPEGACDLNTALGHVQKQVSLQPRWVPRGEVFRPHRWHLEHLAPMDFLGKAKVVVATASAVPGDQHRGVRPQQLQALREDGGAGPGAGPRAHGSGPSRAGPHLGPRTSPGTEMEVSFGQAEQADHCVPVTDDKQGSRTEQADKQAPPGLPAAGGPDLEPSEDHPGGGVSPGGSEPPLVTITVQCAFTLALRAPRGAAPPTLRALLSQALPLQAERGQLRWVGSQWGAGGWAQLAQGSDWKGPGALRCLAFEVGSGPAAPVAPLMSLFAVTVTWVLCWVPLPEEGALQTAWWESASGPAGLRLQCRGAGGRPVLYQVVARHGYSAQGPEDLDLQPGDIVDVLCEVDQEWLEGHCDGCIGIFPKCFVVPARPRAQRGQP
ncbi:LOW QUALITY PROTEIN: NADPH oxidase activator 1 [Rousettus aegyptiacus]|uniref:LOW QUALITY PROTEIN: NADPH oxidase activator 1 n=1 Tax=Rousettus aegyptiacus TaxID=9407 RepID=UPI00168D1883|nr:LOW QUALITY PROTEIN: NADPH oxidase activator 1 [Rousettus aegyptiacus]